MVVLTAATVVVGTRDDSGAAYGRRVQRLGVVFPDRTLSLRAQRAHVDALADWGYTDLWAGESDGADAIGALTAAAAWDTPLRMGTAVVSAFLRPRALLAMSAAALHELATGGFVVGIGASSPVIVERWNDVSYVDPAERVRNTAVFLRRVFAGERVHGFRLARAPVTPPPVYLAALRPAMLRLASEVADGVILTCVSVEDVARMREFIAPDREVVAWLTVCPSDDAVAVRAAARSRLAGYLAAPAYEAQQRWLGRGAVLQPMWDAWRSGAGITRAAALIPDEVVDALVVHGSPDACTRHIERFIAGGVTTPILDVLPGVVEVADAWRMLAPQRRS